MKLTGRDGRDSMIPPQSAMASMFPADPIVNGIP